MLRLGELFRLRINREQGAGSAVLELAAPHEAPRVAAGWRALAMALVAGPEACGAFLSGALTRSGSRQHM